MKPPYVWFNKHLSNTWEGIALLDEARRTGEMIAQAAARSTVAIRWR